MRIALLSTMDGYYGGEVHLAGLAAGWRPGHEVICLVRPGQPAGEVAAPGGQRDRLRRWTGLIRCR